MNIQPLQLARVSNLLTATMTSSQLTTVQKELLNVENQLSTGKLFSQPSDDPSAASVTMQLQRTLDQRQTYLGNLASAQSQLGRVDSTLGDLTTLIQHAQTIASADVNSSTTPAQRTADAQIIDSIFNQALSIGNSQYNGLYLFAGDKNTAPPFVTKNGGVQFVGSTTVLQTTVDTTTQISFMVSSAEVFGAASSQVQGTADLTPNLTAQTRLSDLRGASRNGFEPGEIQLGNGTTSKIVDLSQSDNLGDVVNAINSARVGGITASLTGQGITLTGNATDNITVQDVDGGATADSLGILRKIGSGPATALVGANTGPNVTEFTPLSSLKAGAGIDSHGLKITNGLLSANVSFAGLNTVGDVLNAINGSGTNVLAKINSAGTGIDIVNPTQGLRMTVAENGGTTATDLGVRSFSPQTLLTDLNGGRGVGLAFSGADFQITRSDGTNFNVTLAGAQSVQDVIAKINTASGGVGLTASFSATTNAITLTDTAGGAAQPSVVSQNGSTAAADLGLTQNAAAGGTITGTDVNPVTANGVFADLGKLRDALNSGDQAKITEAAEGLQKDYNQIVQARGSAGAQVQAMQTRQDQIKTESSATQSLMSQLSDTDFTAAITRFQSLQTSLQATLQASAKTLNLSLLSFLG